jgi:hypothetical protein
MSLAMMVVRSDMLRMGVADTVLNVFRAIRVETSWTGREKVVLVGRIRKTDRIIDGFSHSITRREQRKYGACDVMWFGAEKAAAPYFGPCAARRVPPHLR